MPESAAIGTTLRLMFDLTGLVLVDIKSPAVSLVPGPLLPPVAAAAPRQEDDDHRAGAGDRGGGGDRGLSGEPGGEREELLAGPGVGLLGERLDTDSVGSVRGEAGDGLQVGGRVPHHSRHHRPLLPELSHRQPHRPRPVGRHPAHGDGVHPRADHHLLLALLQPGQGHLPAEVLVEVVDGAALYDGQTHLVVARLRPLQN